MLGYADESGEPGVKKNEHDYFVFCVILVKDKEQALKIQEKMAKFRKANNLSEDHEFHYVTDSKKVRPAFAKFIKSLDFKVLSVSIKKDDFRGTASFANMSELALELLEKKNVDVSALMDVNPRLCRELNVRKKNYAVKLHFKEAKSHANDLIQVADYVVALRARFLKYPKNSKIAEAYYAISGKIIGLTEI